jgi:hypothetical protein
MKAVEFECYSFWSFIKPFDVATVLPYSSAPRSLSFDEDSAAVLLTIPPLTIVNPSISPGKNTVAFPFIIFEFSGILLSIFPLQFAHAMHLIFEPFAFKRLTVWPNILAAARNLVLKE